MSNKTAQEIAAEYNLISATKVSPLSRYLGDTWKRKDFILELAGARSTAQYSDSLLGRLWQLLTPLMNAAIYYLIFGVLLGTKKGIDNYTAYLVAGVFAFNFMQTTITSAASSLPKNESLVKAIHFPRLVLPVATVFQQVQQYFVSLGVLAVVALVSGEGLSAMWLALPFAVLLQICFTIGFSLIVARWGARNSDINQLLPFFTRTWRYASGVFFSIAVYSQNMHSLVGKILSYNPGAVYIDLVRDCLMTSQSVPVSIWVAGIFWATAFLATGLLYFHKGEAKYV